MCRSTVQELGEGGSPESVGSGERGNTHSDTKHVIGPMTVKCVISLGRTTTLFTVIYPRCVNDTSGFIEP